MKVFPHSEIMSMRQTLNIFLAVAGLLLLAFTGTAVADDVSRPFSATTTGYANLMPTDDPCILDNTETIAGQALHLGKVTGEGKEVIYLMKDDTGSCLNSDKGVVIGKFFLIAANGDQINGSLRTIVNFDFQVYEVTAFGRYAITGGTGRFEGATGEGDITVSGNLLPPFEVTGGLFGRISY